MYVFFVLFEFIRMMLVPSFVNANRLLFRCSLSIVQVVSRHLKSVLNLNNSKRTSKATMILFSHWASGLKKAGNNELTFVQNVYI